LTDQGERKDLRHKLYAYCHVTNHAHLLLCAGEPAAGLGSRMRGAAQA